MIVGQSHLRFGITQHSLHNEHLSSFFQVILILKLLNPPTFIRYFFILKRTKIVN